MEENKILPPSVGTELKISVTANLGNDIHMADVDFTCCFYTDYSRKRVEISKGDGKMLYISNDLYIAIVDTKEIGAGQYYMKFTAKIPDTDCEDGFREEVVTIPTGINVKN